MRIWAPTLVAVANFGNFATATETNDGCIIIPDAVSADNVWWNNDAYSFRYDISLKLYISDTVFGAAQI